MTKTIKISGASDDLIEIDGDISDEGGGAGYVELSTGDVFFVDYDGVWNVQHVVNTETLEHVEIFHKEEEDDDGYTGHALITGDIRWVDFWDSWPPEGDDMRERLVDHLDDLCGEALVTAYRSAFRRIPNKVSEQT